MKLSLPGRRALEIRREKDGAYALSVQRAGDPTMSVDQYLAMAYQGLQYSLLQTGQTIKGHHEDIGNGFANYVQGAYKSNGIVFACMLARMMAFSEVRFQWRKFNTQRVPADLWGNQELGILEHPWPNATTGDLLVRAIQDVDLAGNFYAVRDNNQIKRLRPDWVTIVVGSPLDPSVELGDIEAEVVGYLYHPGGPGANKKPVPLLREQVCHFAPIPDPTASFRGMSWITPVLREIMADTAATAHKLAFFQNGATVNHVISLDKDIGQDQFNAWIDTFEAGHKGAVNAYKTWYLGGGATYTAIGSDFQQMDFRATQGAGEVRIAAAAGVPPTWVNFSDALQGSSLNAGNKAADRRRFADGTIRPLWRNFCGSMSTLVNVPGMSELWYDDRDVAFLREDRKDAAEIHQVEATSINTLIMAGYKPDAVIEAVVSGDYSRLNGQHTGLFSVQLQPPLTSQPDEGEAGGQPAKPSGDTPGGTDGAGAETGRSMLEPALVRALARDPAPPVVFEAGAIVSNVTVESAPTPSVTVPITVQPAESHVEVPVTVQPAEVSVPVTVQPANAPNVTIDAPVTVTTPEVTVQPADINVDARTTVAEGAVRSEITVPSAPKPGRKRIKVRRADGTQTTATIEEE